MSTRRITRLGLFVCTLTVCGGTNLYPASWIRTVGTLGTSDWAGDLVLTSDGGCVVAGQAGGRGLLFRCSASGAVKGLKSYGGTDYGYFRALDLTSDGGFMIAGDTIRARRSSSDFWCIKAGPKGKVLWQKSYGGSGDDEVEDALVNPDGGCFLVGMTRSFGAGNSDAWCMRLDASGNVLWQKALGGPGYDYAFSIAPDSGGGCVIAGSLDGSVWLFKMDASGTMIWSKVYNGASSCGGRAAVVRSAGGGLIVASSAIGGLLVAKLDAAGGVVWQKRCDESYSVLQVSPHAWSVRELADGSVLVSGDLLIGGYSNYYRKAFLRRFDGAGTIVWQKDLLGDGHPDGHIAASTGELAGGDLLVAGYTTGRGRHGDAFVLRLSGGGDYEGDCDRVDPGRATVGDYSWSVSNATVTETITSASGSASSSRPRRAALDVRRMCD